MSVKSKPRVCHLVLSLKTGGLERFVLNLVATSAMQEYDNIVCCLDEPGELAAAVERVGVPVFVIKRKPGLDLGLVWRLARFFKKQSVDILHTHSLDPMFYGFMGAALVGIKKRIHTQHNTFLNTYDSRQRFKFHRASRLAEKIVAVSSETNQGLAAFGIPAHKTITILNGIDEDHFATERISEPGIAITFGAIGRLAPEKGIRNLLEAFALASAEIPSARLIVVGDGPERPALEQQVQELGIPGQVQFVGQQNDVLPWLRKLDVYVLPSLSEGIPLALLEAMASGLPVVCSAVGGVPEVVADNASGILVPAGDTERLATAMTRCARNAQLRTDLGTNAKKRIESEFSLSAMSGRYSRLYAEDAPRTLKARFLEGLLRTLPSKLMVWRERSSKGVALTFDDGPDAKYTPQILSILKRHNVQATFFLVGEKVALEPKLVEQIVADGHELGNHTFTHRSLDSLSLSEASREIRSTQVQLEPYGASARSLFRPPRGKLSIAAMWAAWRQRMKIVMWSVDLKDFRARHEQEIVARLDAQVMKAGDIVLYHGTNDAAVAALPKVIEHIKKNARTVTVSSFGESQ